MKQRFELNPCRKCGTPVKQVQDYGDFALVRCKECGASTGAVDASSSVTYCRDAAEAWNAANPLTPASRPKLVEGVSREEFRQWCARARRDECLIWMVDVKPGGYTLHIRWPPDGEQHAVDGASLWA